MTFTASWFGAPPMPPCWKRPVPGKNSKFNNSPANHRPAPSADFMQKTSINPEILQPMFEAAANAATKGQSQFYTPMPFGRKLAEALPKHRPSIVDLNCGLGHLLEASGNQKTLRLLGADIDSCRGKSVEGATLPLNRITCDITRLYPWLKEIGFTADLFVLNPPWRLF